MIFCISKNSEGQSSLEEDKSSGFFIIGYHSVHKKPYIFTVELKINKK